MGFIRQTLARGAKPERCFDRYGRFVIFSNDRNAGSPIYPI